MITPFYLANKNRLTEVILTVANRDNNTTNGANNFWMLIDKVGNANQLYVTKISVDNLSKTILICLGLFTIIMFIKKYYKYFTHKYTLPLECTLNLTLILNTIYFYFGTKMHSRYLHIGLVCSFFLLIFPSYFKNTKYITSIALLNLGYFINQITTYNGDPKNIQPAWIGQILQPLSNLFLNQLSSVFIMLSLLLLLIDLYSRKVDFTKSLT
ncbi:hypothetical protein HC864_02220 [Candidatus Gracilibacteria bacterium]|nr:hypothetical protein [Candidatus Gracilibacteria bacterium]